MEREIGGMNMLKRFRIPALAILAILGMMTYSCAYRYGGYRYHDGYGYHRGYGHDGYGYHDSGDRR
jgi:hypothetical protein